MGTPGHSSERTLSALAHLLLRGSPTFACGHCRVEWALAGREGEHDFQREALTRGETRDDDIIVNAMTEGAVMGGTRQAPAGQIPSVQAQILHRFRRMRFLRGAGPQGHVGCWMLSAPMSPARRTQEVGSEVQSWNPGTRSHQEPQRTRSRVRLPLGASTRGGWRELGTQRPVWRRAGLGITQVWRRECHRVPPW